MHRKSSSAFAMNIWERSHQKWKARGDRQHVKPPQEQSSKETCAKNMVPSIWCSTRWSWFLREALFFWDLPFLPNCINVNLWPLKIRQQGVFQISLETTANNKWLPLYSPMCGLCIPAWEPNTEWKELQVKGHAAFPPRVTIQSLDHQWPVNQEMNNKWTRGTNSQEPIEPILLPAPGSTGPNSCCHQCVMLI